ncbi:hypothetical protein [Leptolyngbya sp. PCC 6406]|uniref:hypothetical protein n=1 Tax=Leptolyngbya sp. PCC 6406 TaxID=1173264 RepID=UPI0002DEFA8F|nr:hypothetical protein [Leptolyngbya sp. PCC 6406]
MGLNFDGFGAGTIQVNGSTISNTTTALDGGGIYDICWVSLCSRDGHGSGCPALADSHPAVHRWRGCTRQLKGGRASSGGAQAEPRHQEKLPYSPIPKLNK